MLEQKQIENSRVQQKLSACFTEPISGPQKVLGEVLETLAPDAAKVALIEYLRHLQNRSRTLTMGVRGAAYAFTLRQQQSSNDYL